MYFIINGETNKLWLQERPRAVSRKYDGNSLYWLKILNSFLIHSLKFIVKLLFIPNRCLQLISHQTLFFHFILRRFFSFPCTEINQCRNFSKANLKLQKFGILKQIYVKRGKFKLMQSFFWEISCPPPFFSSPAPQTKSWDLLN